MPDVDNKGINIHYRLEGNGPPLVLLHGLFGSSESWYANGYVEKLRTDYQLILIDQRGHGNSSKPHKSKEYSLKGYVEDVLAVIDETGVNRVHVFGHSFGGWIAYGLAQYAPDRMKSIVISDGVPGRGDPEFIRKTIESFDEWVASLADASPAEKTRLLMNDRHALLAIADWAGEEIMEIIELIDNAIGRIDFPCLILTSNLPEDSDEYRLLKKSADTIPDATSVTFDELSHMNLHRQSDLVLPHIMEFLATVT